MVATAVVLLAVTATASNHHVKTTVSGGITRTTVTMGTKHSSLVGSSGSGATDPPVPQPHKMVIAISNFCAQSWLNNSAEMTFIYPGGGGFYLAPPWAIPPGGATLGFIVEADPGSDVINGTAVYFSDTFATFINYEAVSGFCAFSISYPTEAAVMIQPGVIGRKAIYNVVFGHPHNITLC